MSRQVCCIYISKACQRRHPHQTLRRPQPPRAIEYEYRQDNIDSRIRDILKTKVDESIDKRQFLLLLNRELPEVENGGQIVAVFSCRGP